jgi:hypothetical protein
MPSPLSDDGKGQTNGSWVECQPVLPEVLEHVSSIKLTVVRCSRHGVVERPERFEVAQA